MKDLVKKFGDQIFELFAVMVHSGSAWSGHYYALIFDSQTHKWYCFDDQKVSAVGVEDVFATFGEENSKASSGTSAYMLFYRKYNPERENPKEIMPPHNIQVSILKEKEIQLREKEEKKSILHLRVLFKGKEGQKEIFLTMNKKEQIAKLKEKIESQLGIVMNKKYYVEIAGQNNKLALDFENEDKLLKEIPLKMLDTLVVKPIATNQDIERNPKKKSSFHIIDDLNNKSSRLNTFLSKNNPNFKFEEESKISSVKRKSSIDVKSDRKIEENFIFPKKKKLLTLNFKIVEWRDGLISLEDNLLNPVSIEISINSSFEEFRIQISKQFGIRKNELLILQRLPFDSKTLYKIICLPDDSSCEKKISCNNDLYNGMTLFIERKSATIKWEKEFELESNRGIIITNDPSTGNATGNNEELELIVDLRIKFGELKEILSHKFSIPMATLIIKKGNIHIFDETKSLKELGFAKQTKIQISFSNSSSFLILHCSIVGLNPEYSASLSFLHQGNFEIVLDNGNISIKSAKSLIQKELVKQGIIVSSEKKIRLREIKDNNRLSVLRNNDSLPKLKGKLELMVEILDAEEDRKEHERLLYIKCIDESVLSFPFEIWMHKDCFYHHVAKKVEEIFGLKRNEIEFMKKDLSGKSCSGWIVGNEDKRMISENPWNISKDGELILVRKQIEFTKNPSLKIGKKRRQESKDDSITSFSHKEENLTKRPNEI